MRNFRPWTTAWGQDLAWLIVRVTFGLALATHGYAKLFGAGPEGSSAVEAFAQRAVEPLGFPAPLLFAYMAALSEFFGGLLIALGLLTPLAALMAAFTMAVAAFHHLRAGDPFKVYELAVIYLAIAIAALLRGGGRFSLDSLIPFFRSNR